MVQSDFIYYYSVLDFIIRDINNFTKLLECQKHTESKLTNYYESMNDEPKSS